MTLDEAIKTLSDFQSYPWNGQDTTDLSKEECEAVYVLLKFAKKECQHGD